MSGNIRRLRQSNLLIVLGAILSAYLVVPIIVFVIRFAGTHSSGLSTPGLFGALGVSAITATTSTAIIALLGIPLAYVLVRFHSRLSTVIGLFVQLPLAIPPLMSGMLLIVLVGPNTPIGRFFHGALTETLIGVVLAQIFVAAPFLIVVARTTFATISGDLFDAAATLGYRESGMFFAVALPAAREGIFAGLLLAWLRAFGEYGATVILAYHPYSLPIFTYLQFSGTGLAATEAPTALAIVVAVVVVLLSRAQIASRRHRYRRPSTAVVPKPALGRPLGFSLAHRAGDFLLEISHPGGARRLAILGPSGSGKSLTLRALAGLFGEEAGEVFLGGERISSQSVGDRRVGYVPQHSALLAYLEVGAQVNFGVGTRAEVADYWIERLGLRALVDQRVEELSGGERQRVALARALSRDPELLLLDEPFSALDAAVRREMQRELRDLQGETGLSTVLVTHDFDEAALLADEIMVIFDGRLVQQGGPEEIYRHPVNAAVARLAGLENVFAGVVVRPARVRTGTTEIDLADSQLEVGTPVLFTIDPGNIVLPGDARASGRIVDRFFRAGTHYAMVRVSDDIDLTARLPVSSELAVSDVVGLDLVADIVRAGESTDLA